MYICMYIYIHTIHDMYARAHHAEALPAARLAVREEGALGGTTCLTLLV